MTPLAFLGAGLVIGIPVGAATVASALGVMVLVRRRTR